MRNLAHIAAACALGVVLLLAPARARAVLNGSFETGDLSDWTTRGDVSIVDGSFGTAVSDGSYQVLLSTVNSTLGDPLEPVPSFFSGTDASALNNGFERWMRITTGTINDVLRLGQQPGTEGSAIRQEFTGNAGDLVAFDWNFLTNETTVNPSYDDFAVVTLAQRIGNGNGPGAFQLVSASVLVNQAAASYQAGGSGTQVADETGFGSYQAVLPVAGSYILSVAVFDAQNQVVASALLIDNVRTVPEPASLLLVSMGLLGLTWIGRRRSRGAGGALATAETSASR